MNREQMRMQDGRDRLRKQQRMQDGSGLTVEQLDAYLKKLGCEDCREVSLSNLGRLMRQQLMTIPYENLDCVNRQLISLDGPALYEKMVKGNRGGFCFELQGLFYEALLALGYEVRQHAGRFWVPGDRVLMRRHRVLVVTLDGTDYVVDAGIRRDTFREPLLLEEGREQWDGLAHYRIDADPIYGHLILAREQGKDWTPLYGFTDELQYTEDYAMPCYYLNMHPDSDFCSELRVSLLQEDSSMTLNGNVLKVYSRGQVRSRQVLDGDEAIREALQTQFGIDVPENYKVIPE